MKEYAFQIDCHGETRQVTKHWQFCIGSGHAALAQRADYLEQLKTVHDELGIQRVRFHGIFNDDMNVCIRLRDHLPAPQANRTKLYDFYQIGRVYDHLLDIGVRPFVELSFMPAALASGRKTVFHYRGNVTLPKKMAEWQDFITAFVRFLINRYGREEVRRWFFEVWNEPDLPCFFKGSMGDYYRLYAATVRALKSVDSQLTVGGPATTKSGHIPEFLDFCRREDVPVDFVSTHQYPTDALGHEINRERVRQLKKLGKEPNDRSLRALLQPVFDNAVPFTPELKGYMTREAERAKREAGGLPLYYTEWSISSNCVAAVHDTPRCAAFLVKTVLDHQGIVDGSSYWTFSDIFEELFFFTDPFCGGFGLLTVDGIKKPSFWAFRMLARLPDVRYCLPDTVSDDVGIAAFRADDGGLAVMLYAQSFQAEEQTYQVHLKLENAPHFSSVRLERIGSGSGDAAALWRGMGCPSQLSARELEQLKRDSQPEVRHLDVGNVKGQRAVDITLRDDEVVFLEFQC